MGNKKFILLVDDDSALRELLEMFLEMNNFQTILASNGKEGIEKIKNIKVDLLIVDLIMPTMDGLRFLKKLRQDLKLESPIIVLSGLNKNNIKQEALEGGATEVIFKPIDPDALLKRIHHYIEA